MPVTSDSYGSRMQFATASVIRYAGTYRYSDRVTLERALSRARAHIEDADELALEGGWMRCFVILDTVLTINLALPALREHRDAASEVFDALARAAIDGSVRATIDDRAVDEIVSGDDE
ncbi:MAG: hypothetical protein WKG01_01095 [Kofleriaceae bacterium]